MKIMVADPRRTDTAEMCRPVPAHPARHRRDAVQRHAAHHAVGRLDGRAYIAAHTSGFDELKATVRDCTPDVVAQTCGISQGRPASGHAPVCHIEGHR
jgi:assimilatory nitrate reductase catalytic subunit